MLGRQFSRRAHALSDRQLKSLLQSPRHVIGTPSHLTASAVAGRPASYASIADKYQEKLKQRAKVEGFKGGNAIDQLRQKYKLRVKEQEKERDAAAQREVKTSSTGTQTDTIDNVKVAGAAEAGATTSTATSTTAAPPTPPPSPKPGKKSPIKTLDSFIDVDKFRLHDPSEMAMLWRARFADSATSICAVIPASVYATLYKTARRYPMFVLPLFRNAGEAAEMHFLQWQFPAEDTAHLVITSLIEYKTHGEYARPHTIVTHHAELANEKGLVFMRGDLTDSRALEPIQASWMMSLLQRFYCPDERDPTAEGRKRMVEAFNSGNGDVFSVDRLIEEAKAVPGAADV